MLSQLPASTAGFLGIADFPTLAKSKAAASPQGLDILTFTYLFATVNAVAYQ